MAAAGGPEGGGRRAVPGPGDRLVPGEAGPRRDADRQRRGEGLQHHDPVRAEGGETAGLQGLDQGSGVLGQGFCIFVL